MEQSLNLFLVFLMRNLFQLIAHLFGEEALHCLIRS